MSRLVHPVSKETQKLLRRWAFSLMLFGTAFAMLVMLAGCGDEGSNSTPPDEQQRREIEQRGQQRQPYTPKNEVEFNNFNEAQRLYDSPNTIIWCTAFPSNPNAPFVTTPIKGKLTSSSVSYQRQEEVVTHDVEGDGFSPVPAGVGGARSSDGMYHGSPPPYRYGFTPGGIYVDFFNVETFCTTALTKFQRENTDIAVSRDDQASNATKQAEQALKDGDPKRAEEILSSLENSGG